ncbi:hypothetical protein BJF85_05045 [Saccharomonospora sp. CUA-673]|uniref:hypothetical protein n=1 Tax=Saccharomonospora sp. CUA-673 TaxID=1904969 RepID=UPI00095DA1E1|nr:hypothetical protein [Saccharomonospora sp. CUA-673]OLT41763.1 hypothetical protein BJF85_05045 [Saccharomonospora sp. CUA-673]
MESLLYTVALLACPVGMGLMMWMMRRGNGSDDKSTQVKQLRAEVEQLKAERSVHGTEGTR